MRCKKCKAPVKYLRGVGIEPPLLYDDSEIIRLTAKCEALTEDNNRLKSKDWDQAEKIADLQMELQSKEIK